jgi:hypothetical protein
VAVDYWGAVAPQEKENDRDNDSTALLKHGNFIH